MASASVSAVRAAVTPSRSRQAIARTLGGEALRDTAPDAVARAGDQRGLAREPVHRADRTRAHHDRTRPVRTTSATATIERLANQGHLVGGRWQTGATAGTYEHRYAATGAVQATVGLAGADEVDAAVHAAASAAAAWRETPAAKPRRNPAAARRPARRSRRGGRADRRARQRHTRGRDATGHVRPRRWVRYYAGWCDKLEGETSSDGGPGLGYVRIEPYGVVAAIPPWNGSMMGMGQKVAAGARRGQRRRGQGAGAARRSGCSVSPSSPPRRACRPACSTS